MNEISVIDGKRVWIYQRDSLGNNSARVSGYYRNLEDWNEGKQKEFSRRKEQTF